MGEKLTFEKELNKKFFRILNLDNLSHVLWLY